MKRLTRKDNKNHRKCAVCGRIREYTWTGRATCSAVRLANAGNPYTICNQARCLEQLAQVTGQELTTWGIEPDEEQVTQEPATEPAQVTQEPEPTLWG